jgi:hypothetical protein
MVNWILVCVIVKPLQSLNTFTCLYPFIMSAGVSSLQAFLLFTTWVLLQWALVTFERELTVFFVCASGSFSIGLNGNWISTSKNDMSVMTHECWSSLQILHQFGWLCFVYSPLNFLQCEYDAYFCSTDPVSEPTADEGTILAWMAWMLLLMQALIPVMMILQNW